MLIVPRVKGQKVVMSPNAVCLGKFELSSPSPNISTIVPTGEGYFLP